MVSASEPAAADPDLAICSAVCPAELPPGDEHLPAMAVPRWPPGHKARPCRFLQGRDAKPPGGAGRNRGARGADAAVGPASGSRPWCADRLCTWRIYRNVVPKDQACPPGLLRQHGAGVPSGEARVIADHRASPRLAADGLILDHHGQGIGGRADRGGEPGRARAAHRHMEDLPGRDRPHQAEGVGCCSFDVRAGRPAANRSTTTGNAAAEFVQISGRARRWRKNPPRDPVAEKRSRRC